ncbi:agmatine deiminase family protein [Saccharicrinis sp. FJH2]|uniref:agmatine deiminase family protein n=1 Tax=Saccharicrinis sp. FJH65 TaxID=3344659 RepID=UPI0035F3BC3A
MKSNSSNRILPAEWHSQSAIQLTWPDAKTDWNYILDEVISCYQNIAKIISDRQRLLVVCRDPKQTAPLLSHCDPHQLILVQAEINDTWARDHAFITVLEDEKPVLLDFGFNGWGNKFDANEDNKINQNLLVQNTFSDCRYEDHNDFILEGGSIESDGQGTVLTTSECLLSATRNPVYSKTEIEHYLKNSLGAERILWLDHGYLNGDDTDSHIDTLARFCSQDTIAYVKCNDENDVHFQALNQMEAQLKTFVQENGNPYNLIALPMAQAVYDKDDGHRLPATYANFLIINDAVVMPVYNLPTDTEAGKALQKAFPGHTIIPVDCSPLIRQHGSLHCISMQYPAEVKFSI